MNSSIIITNQTKREASSKTYNIKAYNAHDESETVFVCDFPTGNKWLPGTVIPGKDPLSFLIIDDDRVISHPIDHIGECPPSTIISTQITPFHSILIIHQLILLLYLTVDYDDHPAQGKQQIIFIKPSDLKYIISS